MYRGLHSSRLHQLTRIICREFLESALALCFAWLEAPPADTNHLVLESTFVLCFARLEVQPADKIHLQGVSGINMCVAFYTA